MDAEIEARFWPKVDKRGPDECWPWTAGTDQHGYGKLSAGRGVRLMRKAHRISWEIANGTPGKLHVLHRCDNPNCVNPAHLRLGTHAENIAEMDARGRRGGNGLPFGEDHGNAKLSEDDVREIRRLSAGGMSQRALARRFGVSRCPIRRVVRNEGWTHVEGVISSTQG